MAPEHREGSISKTSAKVEEKSHDVTTRKSRAATAAYDRNMTRYWPVLAGALILLAASAGAYWLVKRQVPPPKKAVSREQIIPPGAELQWNGKIRAASIVSVAAPIDGVLEELAVKPADEVFEGQLLGRIKNDTLTENERELRLEAERAEAKLQSLESALLAARLELSRAEADASRARTEYQQAERAYQRQSMLNREGATPRKTFEIATKAYESSKEESTNLDTLARAISDRVDALVKEIEAARKAFAEQQEIYEKAKSDLAAAELHSPADGVVVSVKKSAGEEVAKDEPGLVDIATELTSLELVIEPEPPALSRMKVGLPAQVRVAEMPGEGIPARIRSMDGGVVVLEFASPNPVIRPGMTALGVVKLP
jgi:multidrug resistance efflux pump